MKHLSLWTLCAAAMLAASGTARAQTIVLPAAVNYPAPATGSVSTTATVVATPGAKVTKICNTTAAGGGNIWLNASGAAAASGTGDEATAGGGCVTYTGKVTNLNGNIITGASDGGTATYTVTTGN